MQVFIHKWHLQDSTIFKIFIYLIIWRCLVLVALSGSCDHVYVWVCAQSHPTLHPRLLCPWNFPGKNIEWISISFSRGSSQPRDQTHISWVSCIGRGILGHCATWEVWGSFNCGMQTPSCRTWDLGPWPEVEPGPPALAAWSHTPGPQEKL